MRREQKIVAIGAATGVASMVLGVWLLARWLPFPDGIETLADRIAYALRINLVAVLPLFIMIISIANSRFLSDAIDPTLRAENQRQVVDGRTADNTLQQNFVFAAATLALATLLSADYLHVLCACAIVFVVARVVFWIGYASIRCTAPPGCRPRHTSISA